MPARVMGSMPWGADYKEHARRIVDTLQEGARMDPAREAADWAKMRPEIEEGLRLLRRNRRIKAGRTAGGVLGLGAVGVLAAKKLGRQE